MKLSTDQTSLTPHGSGHKIIQLTSSYLFFQLLSFKKYQQAGFYIPQTILLQKGIIKQWIFNSIKQQNKILRKKKQNSTPLNVVKSFCLSAGYNLTNLKTLSQIKTQYSLIRKQQSKKQPQSLKMSQEKKIIQIITTDNDMLSMSLNDFINLVSQNRYNQHTFYDRWKIIRDKINNQSRIDQCYQVVSIRKNHIIESKCHKIIALNTGQITPMSSIELENDQFKDVSPHKQLKVTETKNVQGYKFFDTFLNKKFFSIVQQLIDFIEKNYKCIVQEIKTKFVINKNRQPYLVGINNLIIKPVKKICNQQEFDQYSQKGYLKVQQYIKCLNLYILENQKQSKAHNFALIANIAKKTKCHGDFCKIKVKKLPHLIDPTNSIAARPKHFNLDPAVHPLHKRTVFSDVVNAVRKRKSKVLQKLKQNQIIQYNQQDQVQESSQYEQSDEQIQKNVKVCENCHSMYLHIQKFYEIDFRSGNLIQKKQSLLNNQALRIRSQSEKRLPPILNKSQIQKITPFNKESSSKKDEINNSKQNQNTEKIRSFSLRSKSQNKLLKQHQKFTQVKNRFQDFKKIKLDPIQGSINDIPSKGMRLLALSKAAQGLWNPNNKFTKNDSKTSKIVKAKNFQQAQQNLVQKLSLLPSSSKDQFIYFALKYCKDNLLQQLDRKCFSSQYLPNFYQFMMNSDLNLHAKNRIRKRPQISLKRLSQLTQYPQIVSKSAFHFDTIITDQKTTISFCVITTKMINGKSAVNIPFQNIFIVNDIFDCFIEYIPLVKDILQNSVNKRIILFNYPGQSHTIYNKQIPFNLPQFSFIFDKLLYRLSTEKQQLGFINFKKDKNKFIGSGYGGYLVTSYLANNYQFFYKNLSGVLLINAYKNISQTLKEKVEALKTLYQSDDEVASSEAFLFYSKAIQSSETDKQDLEYKSGLNPIRLQGRVYLLQSLLDMATLQNNHHNSMVQNFENVNECPVHIIYGRSNVLFTKAHAHRFFVFEDTKVKRQQIPQRKFIQIQGGHDLMADNYDDLEKYVQAFILL